jgi:hypothetical protein
MKIKLLIISTILLNVIAITARAQSAGTVTLYEGESIDKKLNCSNPQNGAATMTIADAGSVASANPAVAAATIIDPNGKNGKGSAVASGQVESPTIRINGIKEGKTTITVKLSCPQLFDPTEGIGLAKHQWQKATITIIVIKRPPVETGGDKKPQNDKPINDGPNDPDIEGGRKPSEEIQSLGSPAVEQNRQKMIRKLIDDLQQLSGEGGPMEGDRQIVLAIGQLRGFLSDDQITDEEMKAAREMRKKWLK